MSIISLRLNEKEEKLLKEFLAFEGLGVSSYIKKIRRLHSKNYCEMVL